MHSLSLSLSLSHSRFLPLFSLSLSLSLFLPPLHEPESELLPSLSLPSVYLTYKQPPSTPLNLATAACVSLGLRTAERALKDMLWSILHGYHHEVIGKLNNPIKISRCLLGDAANVNHQTLVITVHWQNNNIRNEKEERLRNDHFLEHLIQLI